MVTIVLISIVASAITSFLVGRIYLNAQYYSSNSGYRQLHVITATHEIAKSIREGGEKVPDTLMMKYRYSLAPLIYRMFISFGSSEKASLPDTFPSIIKEGEKNSWDFFEEYVRPVKEDINNNAFIGWLPFVHNVQLMTTLWNICHCTENITMEIAAIESISKEKNIPLPYQTAGLKIFLYPDDKIPAFYNSHIKTLKENYKNLKSNWYKWLKLINER